MVGAPAEIFGATVGHTRGQRMTCLLIIDNLQVVHRSIGGYADFPGYSIAVSRVSVRAHPSR